MVPAFRTYVHEDPDTLDWKLMLMRELKVTGNQSTEEDNKKEAEMLNTIYVYIALCLVAYAKGSMRGSDRVKPYGMKASKSTKAFKNLPSSTLALTYAAMYMAVRTPQHKLDTWVRTPRSNISSPWTKGTITRFQCLHKNFCKYRKAIFEYYESSDGGEYMGEEPDVSVVTKKKRKREAQVATAFEEDF